MVIKQEITIPPLTKGKKRNAYVYLPVGYGDSDERYPVMYMFDGQNLFDDGEATFGKSWGLKDYLDFTETPLIIAAVECNSVGNGRLSEYSPVDFSISGRPPIAGRGKIYMNWLVKNFKPYIDENFRTLPGRENTGIGGSSMGGLMTLYALSVYNAYFSKGAALSPSLWVCGAGVPDFITKTKFRKNTTIYADYGSRELSNHSAQKSAFAATCSVLLNKGVYLTSRIVPDGTHCESSWEKQIPFFMNALGFLPKN